MRPAGLFSTICSVRVCVCVDVLKHDHDMDSMTNEIVKGRFDAFAHLEMHAWCLMCVSVKTKRRVRAPVGCGTIAHRHSSDRGEHI